MARKLKPGTMATITVNGVEHATRVDDSGIQRFVGDSLLIWLCESGQIDWKKVPEGKLSDDDFRRLLRGTESSLSRYFDFFRDDTIVNPLENERKARKRVRRR